jgi:hypothetical protein
MSRFVFRMAALLMSLVPAACVSTFPTQADIESDLERELSLVSGSWVGSGTQSEVMLTLELIQSGTTVTGSGTFKESSGSAAFVTTIKGTFIRPTLALDLGAFEVGGVTVTGTLEGEYVTVAGIATAIQLVGGPGGAIPILLQETSR